MSGSTGIAANPANAQRRIFRITDIPDVMQLKKGWPVAAQLMRRWFAAAPWEMTPQIKQNKPGTAIKPDAIESRIVTMGWALKFPRVRSGFNELVASWNTPAARTHLAKLVRDQHPSGDKPWRFGDLSQPGWVLDKTCQANVRIVGGKLDPLDDFYGAIGKGALKIAVTGMVTTITPGRYRLNVDEVGVYLRDTYDFNDDGWSLMSQPLGFWGWSGVERTAQIRRDIEIDAVDEEAPQDRLYAVQNDDFRAYRRKHGRGGDFIVYSDVVRVKLARPTVLEL